MSVVQRLTMAAGAAIFALSLAWPCFATDTNKQPAKTEPSKTQPQNSQPTNRSLQQLTTIKAQDPAGPSRTNTFKPNQEMKTAASKGWDTKATEKGWFKLPSSKRADPKVVAQQENQKLKDEQAQTARRFPAIGKAPSAPTTQQFSGSSKSFFSRLFGK